MSQFQFGGELIRADEPAFVVAGAAGDISARADDGLPEEFGDVTEALIVTDLVAASGGNDLGDVGVDVKTTEFVTAQGEWVDEAALEETVAYLCVTRIAGESG